MSAAPLRLIGIDYGTRRIGLAYGDELGVATPLPAVTEADPARRREALLAAITHRRATALVLGLPLNMDGSTGFKAKEVEAFATELRAATGLPVHFVDERLTSQVAEAGMNQRELRAIRARGVVDSRAAALILQDWLDQHVPPPSLPPPS